MRRPDGEGRATDRTVRGFIAADVRTQHSPQLLVSTLVDEVLVHRTDRGQETVRVVDDMLAVIVVLDLEAIIADRLLRQDPHPDALVLMSHRYDGRPHLDAHRLGHRAHRSDGDTTTGNVWPEHVMRTQMVSGDQPVELCQPNMAGNR